MQKKPDGDNILILLTRDANSGTKNINAVFIGVLRLETFVDLKSAICQILSILPSANDPARPRQFPFSVSQPAAIFHRTCHYS